ncbi:MAG: hypothetical protein V1843_01435 [bacterium]
MKKLIGFSVLALFAVAIIAGCGGGGQKYAEVKDILNKMITIQETFTAAVDKAKSPKDVVAAIDSFAKDMMTLAPKMKDLDKKYPELSDKNPPKELAAEVDKLKAVSEKMGDAMTKVAQKYPGNKEIADAFMKFAGAAMK